MATPRTIQAHRKRSGTCPFRDWYWSISSKEARSAVDRLAAGNLGDSKTVGAGVYELRIHIGPGYRVYFAYDGVAIVVLLVGGVKSTQPRDIATAKEYLEDYEQQKRGSK
jgi:putative addiction module killer protein